MCFRTIFVVPILPILAVLTNVGLWTQRSFLAAILVSSTSAMLLFVGIMSYARFKRLLFIVTPPGAPIPSP